MSLLLLFRPRGTVGSVKNGAVAFPVTASASTAARRLRTRAVAYPIAMNTATLERRIRPRAVACPLTMNSTTVERRIRPRAVAYPLAMNSTTVERRIRPRAFATPIVMGAAMSGEVRSTIQPGAVTYPLTLQAIFAGAKVGSGPPVSSGGGSRYLPRTDRRQGRTRRGRVRMPLALRWHASAHVGARLRPAQLRHDITCTWRARGESDVPDLAGVLFAALDLFNDDLLVTTDA